MSAERSAASSAVEAFLAEQPGLRYDRLDEHVWFLHLSGERKKTVGVHIAVGEHQLVAQSFFMRAPDENQAELYAYLLRRGMRSYVLRFGLTDDGDVLLIGVLPLRAVSEEELDLLVGQLLATADESFDVALRLSFASYIEREQAWRAKVGAPRNPIS